MPAIRLNRPYPSGIVPAGSLANPRMSRGLLTRRVRGPQAPSMPPLLPSLASLTAVIGPVVTLIGLIQSRGWLAGLGAVFICVSITAVLYARSQRLRVDAASVEIEGMSIDSLNEIGRASCRERALS